jgi:hypothetical protein
MKLRDQFLVLLLTFVLCRASYAGGPLVVAGDRFDFAVQGKPVVWDTTGAVKYRVPEAGNLGKLSYTQAVARVQSLFQVWQDVATAKISFQQDGTIARVGAYTGGAVNTPDEFGAVQQSCGDGTQSPIVFDANGSLFAALGFDAAVIGFAGPCAVDDITGHIIASEAVLNGAWIDGNTANGELSDNQFDQAFVHEFGHFIGLDHSQINLIVLSEPHDACNQSDVEALPIMFPFIHCQARLDAGLTSRLAPDDEAWVSMLYPETVNDPGPPVRVKFTDVYGVISGDVRFTNGDRAQGANVIALSQSANEKFSVVSGYLYTGNPNLQFVTGDNPGDSGFGSHDPALRGKYDIPVKAATLGTNYTLIEESIFPEFVGGSSVGPLFPVLISPAPPIGPFSVMPGPALTSTDIDLTDSQPRFDQFEGK